MEPIEEPIKYVFSAKVRGVEEKFVERYIGGIGDDALFATISQGWYINLIGSWEMLYVGNDKPNLKINDDVTVTIEKV